MSAKSRQDINTRVSKSSSKSSHSIPFFLGHNRTASLTRNNVQYITSTLRNWLNFAWNSSQPVHKTHLWNKIQFFSLQRRHSPGTIPSTFAETSKFLHSWFVNFFTRIPAPCYTLIISKHLSCDQWPYSIQITFIDPFLEPLSAAPAKRTYPIQEGMHLRGGPQVLGSRVMIMLTHSCRWARAPK